MIPLLLCCEKKKVVLSVGHKFWSKVNQFLVEPKLTVQDNHKPQFINCSKYQPSVKEEEPVGTFVFQVKAVDRDPIENGGKITYTFVSSPGERLRFTIEPDTGIIRTQYVSSPLK